MGFTLIRVHRYQFVQTNKAEDVILLQQLKWPIEYMYVGMQIYDYNQGSNPTTVRQNLQRWNLYTRVVETQFATTGQQVDRSLRPDTSTTGILGTVAIEADDGVVTGALGTTLNSTTVAVGDTLVVNGVAYSVSATGVGNVTVRPLPAADVVATTNWVLLKPQGLTVSAEVPNKTIRTLGIKAHGIPIYNDYQEEFYNSYTTYTYGGPNVNTPSDVGAMLIPFCLYPGTYQPSGHINISRAREFFLTYTSDVINNENVGWLVVYASAINFLLISDGSAILRYST